VVSTALGIFHLQVRFERQTIYDDLSLSVAKGEKITITGPSGSGKSTLLKCLMGFVPIQSGNIQIFEQPLTAKSVWEIRRQIAYVAQEPDPGTGTAQQAIERPFAYRANYHRRDKLKQVAALLEQFALDKDIVQKDISKLSGGEKQRIALVSALLLDRPLLLLDEASSALDTDNKQLVADYIRQKNGLTVISVAHDPQWQNFADRVIQLPGRTNGRKESK